MKYTDTLHYQLYTQREQSFLHEPSTSESDFHSLITSGNVEKIKENQIKYDGKGDDNKGSLSKDLLKNQIYHFVINTAIIARICNSHGLPRETSFTISDIFIRRVDECMTVDCVKKLNDEMVLSYTEQMRNLRKKMVSRAVRVTLNYIEENLHKKITTRDLAKISDSNRSYLCKLFKEQTGKSINKFIIEKRIDVAKNMLLTEKFSISDIALTLYFPSQSYFCKVFKQYTNLTPKAFIVAQRNIAHYSELT